jgi:hypothetical protein
MNDDDQEAERTQPTATVSITVRLRRTTTEEIHVSVPVTDDLIVDEPDGTAHLSGEKVFAAALQLGHDAGLTWRAEDAAVVEIHPLQTPPPGLDGAS